MGGDDDWIKHHSLQITQDCLKGHRIYETATMWSYKRGKVTEDNTIPCDLFFFLFLMVCFRLVGLAGAIQQGPLQQWPYV